MSGETRPNSPGATLMLEWPSYTLGVLYRGSRATIEHALVEIGLSLRDYSALAHINEFGAASQQEVADRSRIDRSDLVKVLDGLQNQDLITRNRDSRDRRRHVLTLTPSGKDALAAGTIASAQATADAFVALTEDELHTLHRLALKALSPSLVDSEQLPRTQTS